MKRESFSAPFWIMLAIGCVCALSFYVTSRYAAPSIYWSPLSLLLFFFLPTLLCTESVVYWNIRKNILNPKAAWAHLLFTGVAFIVLPLIRAIRKGILSRHVTARTLGAGSQTGHYQYVFIFWSLMIIGQFFFVPVLRRSFSKKLAISADTGESVNLLDDIES